MSICPGCRKGWVSNHWVQEAAGPCTCALYSPRGKEFGHKGGYDELKQWLADLEPGDEVAVYSHTNYADLDPYVNYEDPTLTTVVEILPHGAFVQMETDKNGFKRQQQFRTDQPVILLANGRLFDREGNELGALMGRIRAIDQRLRNWAANEELSRKLKAFDSWNSIPFQTKKQIQELIQAAWDGTFYLPRDQQIWVNR